MLLQMSSEKHTWNYIIDLFFEPFNDFIELKKKKKHCSGVGLWQISKGFMEQKSLRISVSIHLPMQGTQVRSLVQEGPTCCEATNSKHHNR